MALSQVQCLDDNHVNPRTHESKPEFFYCEEQRLALEALLRDGREALAKHLHARGRRGFLSDPELETLLGAAEPYDPDSDLVPSKAEDDDTPLSLHYWPDLSDTSVPQLDLGWPDSDSYRGVTRTTVYAQPPLDGQAHIKEVVRKMIAQAQKVIAVVMDVFTDVDIFRDLLDAGFKRRVSVYVLLDRTALPHFTSMCRRANMHGGHLKHLRVRCTDGAEFYTRSCTKVKGRLGHRFMFVDGDKAVSGSYSFTWMSSRLDRNLITVVTGQAVEAFDRLFRHLWSTSRSVDLRQAATEPEPEPEPLPQPAAVVPPSAAIARKLYNPKYALVALGNPSQTPSADSKDPQNLEISKNPDVQETNKDRKKRASKEAIEEVAPLHPGLIDLEKACLISYLPTWPEPDPPSDVIGYINIRDSSKPTQVHLQRSEMFETSQAIRFSSPLSTPKEALPEVAKPRQLDAKRSEVANKTNAVDRSEPARRPSRPDDVECKKEARKQEAPSPGRTSELAEDTTEVLATENKLHSSTTPLDAHAPHTTPLDAHAPHTTPLDAHAPHTTPLDAHAPHTTPLNAHAPHATPLDAHTPHTPPLDAHTPPLDAHTPPLNAHTPPQSSSNGSSSSTQTVTTNSSKPESLPPNETTSATPESNISQSPHPHEANTERCTEEGTNSHTQQQNSHSHVSTSSQSISSTSVCENGHIPKTSLEPRLSASTTSSPLCQPPPIPKPRTIHLVIQGKGAGENLPNISVDWTESLAGTGQVVQTQPEKEPETVPEVHLSETRAQEDAENTTSPDEAPQQKLGSVAPRETKAKQEVTAAETQTSAVLFTDAPKAASGRIQERSPSTDRNINSRTQTDTKSSEKRPSSCERNTPRGAGGHEPPSTRETNPPGDGSAGQRCDPSATPAPHARTNAASRESPSAFEPRGSSHTPERPLRPRLSDTHVPDLRSPTPEREPCSLAALVRAPTPDGFPPHSRTHAQDPRSDLRSPTSDVSDGYVSPRDDSTVSTTSDEYYECSEAPVHDPILDPGCRKNGPTEDHVALALVSAPNATTTTTTFVSPADVNHNSHPADGNPPHSETRAIMRKEENEKQKNVAKRRSNKEAKKSGRDSADKGSQAPRRKRPANKSTGEILVDGGNSTNEGTDPTRLSTAGLKPDNGERSDTETLVEEAALEPGGMEKGGGPQSTRDPDGQKQQQQQQQDSGSSSPTRPPPPNSATQPLGSRPWGSHQLNQTHSNHLHTPPPRRPPPRPPPPLALGDIEAAAVSHTQQQQQPGVGQSRRPHPKHQSPVPLHSAIQPQPPPHSQTQSASEQEEARAPFTITFGRLYSLKGLRDKMNKLPAPSKRGSTSSPAPGRKSTS